MTHARQIYLGLVAVLALGALALNQRHDPSAPTTQKWSFEGPLGTLDGAAARRGFQIYAENCANCHSMNFLHYRDLSGIGFSDAQIKTFAAAVTVPAGFDNQGGVLTKPATPASAFRAPFVSEDAARAALNGSYPPDLSLIIDTYPDGANYLFALLTGYADPPPGVTLGDGLSYNRYFPGHQIAMPPPLNDGQITYTDGTVSTVARNARDVVAFLAWAADPEMNRRKSLGLSVVLYFLAMAAVCYALKRRIWADAAP